MEVKIIVPKTKNQSDPLFYAWQDRIAEVKIGKITFYAWASGDIRITNKKTQEEYQNGNIGDLFDLTDDDISDEFFDWDNNNWFEISAEKDNQFIDLMEACHSYEEAISALENITKEQIKYCNEYGVGE
jgi:hypothetical protein